MAETERFTAFAPGKLYLTGEYSVLDGCPAFIAALDRGVTATFTPGDDSPAEGELSDAALRTAYAYLEEGGIKVKKGSLTIENKLVDEDGNKLGLGSSGAICTAVITAVLKAHGIAPSVSQTFRLAAIAEASIQPNGSFGDVAAAACGGFIEYSPIDSDWLGSRIVTTPVRALVESTWPLVTATRYPWPSNLLILVGWTGEPASTPALVKKYQSAKSRRKKEYQAFIESSRQVASTFERALDRGDEAKIKEAIVQSRQAVRALSTAAEMSLYTKKLMKLVKLSEKCGATAKPSGSWGGDCGFAICDSQEQLEVVSSEWKKAGIVPIQVRLSKDNLNI